MKGSYDIVVRTRRLQIKFTVNRNITILCGDSATGKSTLVGLINEYVQNGRQSGVEVICEKPCTVLEGVEWKILLQNRKQNIIFIDEGNAFVYSKDFAKAVKGSDNYYVIVTRESLHELPYSVNEIYELKNTTRSKYPPVKRLYSRFYHLYGMNKEIRKPKRIIVEDSHAGYTFFKYWFEKQGIPCVSAHGRTRIFKLVHEMKEEPVLVIADGAAFGDQMKDLYELQVSKEVYLLLPESFEWLILSSGLIQEKDIPSILANPSDYIDGKNYFSWEQFFTKLLTDSVKGTYLEYTKTKLNSAYLQDKEMGSIIDVIPEVRFENV